MKKTLCFKNIGELIQVEPATPAKIRKHENCALVIRDGKVLKIVSNTGIRSSSYAQVVDLQGRSV
ncbi:MAG: hypothetical protein AAB932_00085, partial [Patescibacteria group bacterium]